MIAWLFSVCHWPEVAGDTGGRSAPSARATGLLKVSVIGVPGPIVVPGCGVVTTLAAAPAGNQLTDVGGPYSQVRGVAATSIVPAVSRRGRTTVVCGLGRT